MRYDIEARAKLSGNNVIHFNYFHGNRPGRDLSTMEDRPYSCFGPGSRKRLRECLSRWFDTVTIAQEFLRVPVIPLRNHTFLTLTLSSKQVHCDKTIKREVLNHFLIYLKRRYAVHNFLWKAEIQEKTTGNIHYHIITDKYIPHEELRELWNAAQNRLSYVDMFEHKNPNSTDIHSLRRVKNVMAYVGKYMSKSITTRPVCGHVWGRSDGLAKLKPFTLHDDFDLHGWFEMQVNSLPSRQFSGDSFCYTSFMKKMNLRSLPAHHLTEMKRIASENLELLTHSAQIPIRENT
jgi:hypothetical protein